MKDNKQQSLYLVSLGCPKNLVDSEVIAGNLLSNGAAWAYTPDEATIYVINTCAFLPEARQEAAQEIEQAVIWKSAMPSERTIVVCGCLSQYDRDGSFSRRFPEVDIWAGVDDIAVIDVRLVLEHTARIPTVSQRVQSAVKEAVQNMTGITVAKVNVVAAGVHYEEAIEND